MNGDAYTTEEDQVLRRALSGRGQKPWSRLVRELGRTEASLRTHARLLGLLPPAPRERKPQPGVAPKVPQRRCLTCRDPFQPEHRGNFVCDPCKATVTWRASA